MVHATECQKRQFHKLQNYLSIIGTFQWWRMRFLHSPSIKSKKEVCVTVEYEHLTKTILVFICLMGKLNQTKKDGGSVYQLLVKWQLTKTLIKPNLFNIYSLQADLSCRLTRRLEHSIYFEKPSMTCIASSDKCSETGQLI